MAVRHESEMYVEYDNHDGSMKFSQGNNSNRIDVSLYNEYSGISVMFMSVAELEEFTTALVHFTKEARKRLA